MTRACDNAATKMMKDAGLTPTTNEVMALGEDICAVVEETEHADPSEPFDVQPAARELQSRIGGLANLRSYLDCLMIRWNKERATTE